MQVCKQSSVSLPHFSCGAWYHLLSLSQQWPVLMIPQLLPPCWKSLSRQTQQTVSSLTSLSLDTRVNTRLGEIFQRWLSPSVNSWDAESTQLPRRGASRSDVLQRLTSRSATSLNNTRNGEGEKREKEKNNQNKSHRQVLRLNTSPSFLIPHRHLMDDNTLLSRSFNTFIHF